MLLAVNIRELTISFSVGKSRIEKKRGRAVGKLTRIYIIGIYNVG